MFLKLLDEQICVFERYIEGCVHLNWLSRRKVYDLDKKTGFYRIIVSADKWISYIQGMIVCWFDDFDSG